MNNSISGNDVRGNKIQTLSSTSEEITFHENSLPIEQSSNIIKINPSPKLIINNFEYNKVIKSSAAHAVSS